LVEDEMHIRNQLERNISKNQNFEVASFGTFKQANAALVSFKPHIMVLDIGLPDGNGLDLISTALKANSEILILVLTVFGQDTLVLRAVQDGAKGYLLKDEALEHIGNVLVSMLDGASPIDARVARALLRQLSHGQQFSKQTVDKLTQSEQHVLSLIANGKMYKEIAHEMDISINTVREYIRRIYKKLDVNSRTQAMQYANHFNLNMQ